MGLYQWGAAGFGLIAVCGIVALPYAVRCCSRFSPDELAFRRQLGWESPGPAITAALMDWPLGFRLFLMTIVASIICAAAMIGMAYAVHRETRPDATDAAIHGGIAVRVLLSSITVGVLYLLSAYVVGFFGISRGPHNFAWMLGIPLVVAWIGKPGPLGCALGLPLAFTGFVCLVIISMTLQIPLD